MRRRRLFWQLFTTYLLLALVPLVIVTLFASAAYREFHLAAVAGDLEARGRLLRRPVTEALGGSRLEAEERCREAAREGDLNLAVIDREGDLIVDTASVALVGQNEAGRPEVEAALAGRVGRDSRLDDVGRPTLFVALPLPGDPRYILRVSRSLLPLYTSLIEIQQRLAALGLLMTILAIWISFILGRRISRPLGLMRRVAEHYATGQLARRLPPLESEEMDGLAEALNQMAEELDARMSTVVSQRNELEAVLASMVEAVVAVDSDERLLRLNRAAAELCGVTPERATGRTVQEVFRNPDLQRFVRRALRSAGPTEADIHLLGAAGEETWLQATGTLLRDRQHRVIGVLVVLNDITRLRQLENVRRDFVANVSHELRTPVTAIKGFVETLLEGEHEPADVRHFLGIVQRQADRLHHIIEDLLTLSRIEQSSGETAIILETCPVQRVLTAAVQACQPLADEKGIALEVAATGVEWRVNAALLEEAVVNLIDNAIKYSEPPNRVEITAGVAGDELTITVRDHGVGIAPEHLPRLFERFYRVDKARSRKLGGTGLGLAIVKHILNAHGGRVTVDSAVGRGSAFSLHLPR